MIIKCQFLNWPNVNSKNCIANCNSNVFQGPALVQHWSIVSARRKGLCHREPSNKGDTVVRYEDSMVWMYSLYKLRKKLSPTFSFFCKLVHLPNIWVFVGLQRKFPYSIQVQITYWFCLVAQLSCIICLLCFRLLSGVKKHFIFQHHDGKVSVKNNVVVTHLTSVSSKSEKILVS